MARQYARSLQTVAALALAACASAGPGEPLPSPAPVAAGQPAVSWPTTTRQHVDLWLHGFALISPDTGRVPLFKRGYASRIAEVKSRGNVQTSLDVNRDRLSAHLATNRGLVNAQFLGLRFGSWEDLRQAIDLFLRAEGDPGRAGDRLAQQIIAVFAQTFSTTSDRDWLRLFALSLNDENERFFRSWWTQRQRDLAPVMERVQSLWNDTHRARLQPFLNNTQQESGQWILSLPINGEGRSSAADDIIVGTMPESRDAAADAIYVFVHEAVYGVAASAVADNTTPNDRRSGVTDAYTSAAAVRGGYLLLERVAPDLAPGYARYYLNEAAASTSGSLTAALKAAFPLPEAIRDALNRQLAIILGGI
ncbi:MAG: hypothetical protein ACT4PJ_01890 [Gemmatimonadaceae bacterium]